MLRFYASFSLYQAFVSLPKTSSCDSGSPAAVLGALGSGDEAYKGNTRKNWSSEMLRCHGNRKDPTRERQNNSRLLGFRIKAVLKPNPTI